MSEHEMVTEREARKRERDAFQKGATFELRAWQKLMGVEYCSGADSIAEARRRYPMPKVTRLRIGVDDRGVEWRISGSVLQFKSAASRWINLSGSSPTLVDEARVRLWADLFSNPTEEVESDADA